MSQTNPRLSCFALQGFQGRMTWRACSATLFFFILRILIISNYYYSFVYEYFQFLVRQKKLKYSHVTVSQRSWKTKVEAVYRHRWIKRSSRLRLLRAGNVRPKVACRVSRRFLDLLGPFLPPSRFVEVCFLFPSPKIPSAIYSTNFLREKRKAVHLDEGGRIRTTVFHPFSSRFDGVALMATPRSVRHCLLLRECEISSKAESRIRISNPKWFE